MTNRYRKARVLPYRFYGMVDSLLFSDRYCKSAGRTQGHVFSACFGRTFIRNRSTTPMNIRFPALSDELLADLRTIAGALRLLFLFGFGVIALF